MADLHYVSSGEGPAVLFLHGFMGSSSDWSTVMRRLQAEFYCIAVDLPGHGKSLGLAESNRYTMEGACEQLVEVLEQEGVESAHVVGYSMGGRTALCLATLHPSQCRSVVLESASPGLESKSERMERRGMDEARAERLESGDFVGFLEDWYRQPLFHTVRDRPELLERMIKARVANDPNELARSLRGMGTGRQPSLWDLLPDLPTRTLAIAGALDGKYVEIAQRMAVLMPNVRTAIIPNAGHNLHAEHPDAYTEIIRDFLKKPS